MSDNMAMTLIYSNLKRIVDIFIGITLLTVLSPMLALLSMLIKCTSRGPVFFRQERIGQNGKRFILYKFRTMEIGAEKVTAGKYITGTEDVITPLGRIMRRWAIDEIPQLFNVLKGDMSIVGPRPTLPYQVEKYNDWQRKRLMVKPGITGWAQVNGRNKLTWPERIEYDVWYVENWSLWLDIKIIAKTIPALLRKEYAFADDNGKIDEIVSINGGLD